jgi:hypothetical protein
MVGMPCDTAERSLDGDSFDASSQDDSQLLGNISRARNASTTNHENCRRNENGDLHNYR